MNNWTMMTAVAVVDNKSITRIFKKTKKITVALDKQVDDLGNVYQKSGGVNPKACQKCKKEFISEIVNVEKVTKVPWYNCEDCNFNSPSGDASLEHMWMTKHKIKKATKDHVSSIDHKITGDLIPNITIIKNKLGEPIEVEILCRRCLNNG